MLCFRNGPWFKSEGVGQLLISATMDRQPTPFVTNHDRVKSGQPPWSPQKVGQPIGRDAMACGQVVPRSRPRGEQVPRSRTVADSCVAIDSQISFGAGSSRDGRENFIRPSLDD
jgi:hypothetical protein